MRVKLTYFKPSGKYYSEAEYTSSQDNYQVFTEVRSLLERGCLPGLVKNHDKSFTVLVEAGHLGYPALVKL